MRALVNELLGISESYEMPVRLMEILQNKIHREELFEKFLEIKQDLSYDWFTDYYQQEQGDRETLKQDFTPDCIGEIIGRINGSASSIADICAGTGGLTIKLWQSNRNSFFHCEELSSRAIPVLLFNLAIRGINAEVVHGDVLTREIKAIYRLEPFGRFSDIRKVENVETVEYDAVVMNPPYSLKWSGEMDERFAEFGSPPKSKADFAFVMHGMSLMHEKGKLIAILPHGVLFRGAGEGKIRQKLVEADYIRSVIGFPNNLFLNTSIPTLLLEIQKGSEDVLIIDASEEYEKGKPTNIMTSENIDQVVTAYKMHRNIDGLAAVVSKQEILENEYNLNIPRYVSRYTPEEIPDIATILQELIKTENDITAAEKNLFGQLKQLIGGAEQEKITALFGEYVGTASRKEKYEQLQIRLFE